MWIVIVAAGVLVTLFLFGAREASSFDAGPAPASSFTPPLPPPPPSFAPPRFRPPPSSSVP
jgi:hypothetical protein